MVAKIKKDVNEVCRSLKVGWEELPGPVESRGLHAQKVQNGRQKSAAQNELFSLRGKRVLQDFKTHWEWRL